MGCCLAGMGSRRNKTSRSITFPLKKPGTVRHTFQKPIDILAIVVDKGYWGATCFVNVLSMRAEQLLTTTDRDWMLSQLLGPPIPPPSLSSLSGTRAAFFWCEFGCPRRPPFQAAFPT